MITRQKERIEKEIDPVFILGMKVHNKKVTIISGLELFKVDLDELRSHLTSKCSAACTINTEIGSAKSGSKEIHAL